MAIPAGTRLGFYEVAAQGRPFICLCIVSLYLISATSCNTSSGGGNTPALPMPTPAPALSIASSHTGDFTTTSRVLSIR